MCVNPTVMFIPGLECGLLHVHSVMSESFEGMNLNIVVIVTYLVAHVMASHLIYDFILYKPIVKSVVLTVVDVLYKSPLLLFIIITR